MNIRMLLNPSIIVTERGICYVEYFLNRAQLQHSSLSPAHRNVPNNRHFGLQKSRVACHAKAKGALSRFYDPLLTSESLKASNSTFCRQRVVGMGQIASLFGLGMTSWPQPEIIMNIPL